MGGANTFTTPLKITFIAIMSELIDIHPHLYYLVFLNGNEKQALMQKDVDKVENLL